MTESRAWKEAAWCTIVLAGIACAPKMTTGGDGTSSTADSSGSETSGATSSPGTGSAETTHDSNGSAETTHDSSGSTSSTTTEPACPGGDAEFVLEFSLPDPDPPPNWEVGTDDRRATCLVDDATMMGQRLVATMTCDEVGGPTGQLYELGLTLPEGERVPLTTGLTVELTWHHWWAFEFGGGRRLEISTDGTSLLRVFTDAIGAMYGPSCWDPAAQEWMDVIGGTLEEGGCDDVATLKLDLGEGVELFPGQMALLPAGNRKVLLDAARCKVFGDNEDWDIRVADWTPG
jgi:hypothetical protein